MTICDKCGRPASIGQGLKVSFTRDMEQHGTQQLDYEFDLCDQCAMRIVHDVQQAISDRIKGGSGCQTES